MVISDHYNKLDKKDRIAFRDQFCKNADISIITFYKKLRADRFSPIERDYIGRVLLSENTNVTES